MDNPTILKLGDVASYCMEALFAKRYYLCDSYEDVKKKQELCHLVSIVDVYDILLSSKHDIPLPPIPTEILLAQCCIMQT